MSIQLDAGQRKRATELAEWVLDYPEEAAHELIALRDAGKQMVDYIDRNWPGKRSERLPVQKLREAIAAQTKEKK